MLFKIYPDFPPPNLENNTIRPIHLIASLFVIQVSRTNFENPIIRFIHAINKIFHKIKTTIFLDINNVIKLDFAEFTQSNLLTQRVNSQFN